MARPLGRVVLGLVLSVLAAAAAFVDWQRPGLVPAPQAYVLSGAAAVLLLGVLIAFTGNKPPQPEASIPAHVAFASRTPQEITPAPRGARPAAPKPATTDPHLLALQEIDEQIRDLSRRINKAGVMLATGKLSGDAFTKYVDELKRQRGALEADRVRLELRKRTA